jgi:hypothetical protein
MSQVQDRAFQIHAIFLKTSRVPEFFSVCGLQYRQPYRGTEGGRPVPARPRDEGPHIGRQLEALAPMESLRLLT